jgi:hypothetical protein
MNTLFINPKPVNYWTSGHGLFNKPKRPKKAKRPRPCNGTLRAKFIRNKKKEAERAACRQKVKEDSF